MKSRKNFSENVIINFVFLILSCIFVFSFFKINRFNVISDSSFHLTRANEIYQNLKQGSLFTFIATHTFNHTGVANFLFYPTVFLYPLALLRFVFNPITSVYIWVGMFLFLTMVIAYYSMISFSKKRLRSFIFSIVYTLVPYHLYLGLLNGVYGEFIAYTFLPLVFVGIYHILWGNFKLWPILSIGLALECYSHIITTYFSCFLCLILLIIKLIISGISSRRLWNLLKSGILMVILSAWMFIPFITDYLGRGIQAPKEGFFLLVNFNDLVSQSFVNTLSGPICGRSLGILLIIVFFIGGFFVRKSSQELSIYVLGCVLTLCSTTFVDYSSLAKNKLILNTIGNIQFPYRLLSYAGLFLAVTASFVIDKYICEFSRSKQSKALLLLGFTFLSIVDYFGIIQPALNNITQNISQRYLHDENSTKTIQDYKVVDKNNYNMIFGNQVRYGETDYYSKQAFENSRSILSNVTYVNGRKDRVKKVTNANTIMMKIYGKENHEVANLPIIAYHGTYVTNNGHKVNYRFSDRGTVEIMVHKGVNKIIVGYKPNMVYYILFIISVMSWIVLVIYFLKIRVARVF